MRKTRLLTLAVIVLLALSALASASVPPMINYQGKLMKPDGTPVADGTYSITFTIYDAETGGNIRWSEPNVSVQAKGGLFAVLLGGNGTNLPANIFEGPDRWFGIQVNDDPEMIPRQRIASVAYAQVAEIVPDGSITAEKLANQSITAEKLVPGAATPTGTISMFAGATPPAGWLICNGAPVSRAEYAGLFAVIGTTYGAGDGSTAFNLPNLQGRFPLGKSPTQPLGTLGGTATISLQHTHATLDHMLTWNEMPAHNHGVNDPGHAHPIGAMGNKNFTGTGYNPLVTDNKQDWTGGAVTGISIQNAGANWGHNHGSTGNGLSTSQDITNPYVAVNYIIRI